MSTLTTHTTANRDSHSIGLCKFNTTSKAIEVSDGTTWLIYDFDTTTAYTNRFTVDFDGAGDYMGISDQDIFSLGNGSGTDNAFSISTWINADSIGSFFIVTKDVNGGREWVFRTISSQLYFFAFGTGGGYIGRGSSTTLSNGQWYHAVVTYDGSKASSGIKMYLDGSQVDNSNYQNGTYTAAANTTTNVRVGSSERDGFSNGKIDEVAIFNSELTSAQVTNIYKGESSGGSGGTNGKPGDLDTFSPVGWWRMGDGTEAGSGTTIYDASSNSNNGTLNADATITSIGSGESIYV